MAASILGIHHVTAICGDPQQNLDFYTGVLGLRLVKLTVNFDDPSAYHLYYGDGAGSPGSIITFFPYEGGRPGKPGTGQVTTTTYAIPMGSIQFWKDRLTSLEIDVHPGTSANSISLDDPDGLQVELLETEHFESKEWANGPVPTRHAIRGIVGATLSEEGYEQTSSLLQTMGFALVKEFGNRFRFQVGQSTIDILCQPDASASRGGRGTVHHIAFRTPNDDEQHQWRNKLVEMGFNVSPIMDRQYFHSIYFREPGGILFEIATDPPGFAIDEPLETLGKHLKLPPMYEPLRDQIEKLVSPLTLPSVGEPVK